MAKRVLSVLVVDDSAVVRQAATAILSQDPGMVVTVAADPYIALDKMGRSRPNVRDFLHDSAATLIEVVRDAAEARVRRRDAAAPPIPPPQRTPRHHGP